MDGDPAKRDSMLSVNELAPIGANSFWKMI